MRGQDYIAKTRLSNQADETVADVGETCERVAPESLGWLLEQQLIELKAERSQTPAPPEERDDVDV